MTWQNYERQQRRLQQRPRAGLRSEDGTNDGDPGQGTPDSPWTPGIGPDQGVDYTAATLRGTDEYFDPNATSDSWPGVVGLNMRTLHWIQGDEAWDTYEEIGPGDQSVDTGDPNAAGDQGTPDDGTPPGGTPGPTDPRLRTDVPAVNGIPLTWCEEDGNVGDLIGADDTNTITIILQNVQDIGDFYFPVNPEEIVCTFPEDNDYDTDVVGLGEITIPGTSKLETISWSSFLPMQYDNGYVSIPSGLMHPPDYAMQKLIETKRQRLVCFLTVGGTPWNDYVVIKTLNWSSKAGEPGDIFYDITLKRYRSVSIQTVAVPDYGVTDPRDAPALQGPSTDPGSGPAATDSNPNGSDQTVTGEVPVNTDPTVGSSNPGVTQPDVTQSLNRLGTVGSDQVVQDSYSVGFAGAQGQSLQQVYEDLISRGLGDYNSLDKMMSDNKNQDVTILGNEPPFARTKTKIGDFAPDEPLPIGTQVLYWKIQKTGTYNPPYVPPDKNQPSVAPGSPADKITHVQRSDVVVPGSPADNLLNKVQDGINTAGQAKDNLGAALATDNSGTPGGGI